jgi:hypothetical protein
MLPNYMMLQNIGCLKDTLKTWKKLDIAYFEATSQQLPQEVA